MTVILENVHDPHNIGAVLRTCDSVGIQEIHIIYTDPRLTPERFKKFHPSSTGVRKWLHVHLYKDVESCVTAVRARHQLILATHLNEESQSLYTQELTGSVAFMFGNEKDGLTAEALSLADGNINIPQYGMADSLNISVACAVTLYEACRQRVGAGQYKESEDLSPENEASYQHFIEKHNLRFQR